MYIDISFYLRPDEGETVSYFVKHFSSRCVTAFDTAFVKESEGGLHRDREIFNLFRSQRGKPHFIQINRTRIAFKLAFPATYSAIPHFRNLIKILPSLFADSPCRRTALFNALLLWYTLLFHIRSSKSFWKGPMKKSKYVCRGNTERNCSPFHHLLFRGFSRNTADKGLCVMKAYTFATFLNRFNSILCNFIYVERNLGQASFSGE